MPTAFQRIVQSPPLIQLPSPRIEQRYISSSLSEETRETTAQVLEKPYWASYFLPGQLEGKPVQFLTDTGCTTNFLSKIVFGKLQMLIKRLLEESNSHGLLADVPQLPFLESCGCLSGSET